MLHVGSDYEDGIGCPGVLLWRWMIAREFQGMGYGRKAIGSLIAHLRSLDIRELCTSCGLGDARPLGFYEQMGFQKTGDYYGDEPEFVLKLGQ
jgi:diamine N-acetyltransferase